MFAIFVLLRRQDNKTQSTREVAFTYFSVFYHPDDSYFGGNSEIG